MGWTARGSAYAGRGRGGSGVGARGGEYRYRFTLDGFLDGASVAGVWQATRDGQDVLVKSAKLYGRVTGAPAVP